MKKISRALFIMLAGIILASCTYQKVVYVKREPPRKKVEVKIAKPYQNAVWVSGHWKWHHRKHKHIWIPGRWIKAKHNRLWIAGGWEKTHRGWIWVEGYWK
ncbi:MAG: hypothetical protein K8R49_04890 [Candidatus Cloacimonetes bacterium]|nr:hypothetical protein [Candidatus Cloacimonadota bacterium]